MPAPTDHELTIVNRLDGQTLGGILLTAAANLFKGPPRPDPQTASIFCKATGTAKQSSYVDGGSLTGDTAALVKVRVRGNPDKHDEGQAFAQAVAARLHQWTVTGYYEIEVEELIPPYIGQDGAGNHEWSINVILRFTRP